MTTNKNDACVQCPEMQSDNKQGNIFEDDYFDYSPRGQWLRAAVLGASDGLVFIACLMTSVRAAKDVKTRFCLGLSNLFAGAISIAVREYVSVYSQLDVELAQMKRDKRMARNQEEQAKRTLPNPLRVGITAAIAFSSGGVTPLLVGSFILKRDVRLGVVVASASVVLVGFGWVWSVIGGTPVLRSCFRVLFGGLIALAISYAQTIKLSG